MARELVDERSPAELQDELKRLRALLNDVRWFLAGVRGAVWLDPEEMVQKIDATLKGEQ
jgi:hypothetical protein